MHVYSGLWNSSACFMWGYVLPEGGENMTGSQIAMLVTMVAYLLGMVGIGIKLSEKNETVGDFYLGGRKLGPLVTAMSAEASDMSSYLLMGLPGLAYLSGLADVTWTCIGLSAGTYLNWLIVSKRLRRYTEKTDAITLPEFFSKRYVFRALYRIRFCRLRKAFQLSVRARLSRSHADQRARHHVLHSDGRIPCGIHDGLHPEHHHDHSLGHHRYFRHGSGRRTGSGKLFRAISA